MKPVKRLWCFSVTTTPEAEDAIGELLSATLGRPASTYYDNGTGISIVTIYLQQKLRRLREVREEIFAGLKRIKSCGLRIGSGKIVMARMRQEGWADSWKRHFKPIEIGFKNRRDELCESPSRRRESGTHITRPSEKTGRSLLIKPSWSKRKPRKGQAVILLDPGLSFGTGHHPTTAFCLGEIVRCKNNLDNALRWPSGATETASKCHDSLLSPRGTGGERNEERVILKKNAPHPAPLLHRMEERKKVDPSRNLEMLPAKHSSLKSPSLPFLDLGTGSGILAIAAAKLGYSPVHAFDFDPEAVRVARVNARANRVHHRLKIRRGDVTRLPLRPGQRYDLVCANLVSNLLIAGRRRIAAQLNATGTLVLAGILKPEFVAVQKAYAVLGLKLVCGWTEKGWRSGSFRFGR